MINKIIQKRLLGFTLVEFITTMTLTGLFFAVVSIFMRAPINSYANVVNLSALLDSTESALQGLANDLRNAVPNSVRTKTDGINNRVAIEFMQTVEVIRYRAQDTGALNFTTAVSSFDTVGLLQTAPSNSTCAAGACRLIINNGGPSTYSGNTDSPINGLNVYSTNTTGGGAVTISPVGLSITFGTGTPQTSPESNINLSASVLFASASARQKLYISDTPVTYICDLNTGMLRRYWGYTIQSTQPINPSVSPLNSASSALVATNVSSCSFGYTPATNTFNGAVNMVLTFTLNSSIATNTTKLMQQVAIQNSL